MKKLTLIACLSAAMALSACMPTYSDGERVGIVNKLSRKGIIFKSWEGQLVLTSGAFGSDGSVGTQGFLFSVSDDKVASKIQELAGKKVTVHYNEWLVKPFTIDTEYVIVDVKEIK